MATKVIDLLTGADENLFARVVEKIPPIPPRSAAHGPLTRYRLNRFYLFLALIFLAGIAPLVLDASPAWKAFGLGIIFPGAGFLYAVSLASSPRC
jgi:hypothetical protein